jgi:hypothetical protein
LKKEKYRFAKLAALTIFLLTQAGYGQLPTAHIIIESNVFSFTVLIEDEIVGRSGAGQVEIKEIPIGEHVIVLKSNGYYDYNGKIRVENMGQKFSINMIPIPDLVIKSNIAGFKCTVNEIPYETKSSHLTIENLGRGTFSLKCSKHNHSTIRQEIKIADNDYNLIVDFKPLPAELTVTSTPDNVDAYINNTFIGRTEIKQVLAPGDYEIALKYNGFERNNNVTLQSGERKTVYIDMYSQIKFSRNISSVEIKINDKLLTPGKSYKMKPGVYNVHYEGPYTKPGTEKIRLLPGKTYTKKIDAEYQNKYSETIKRLESRCMFR